MSRRLWHSRRLRVRILAMAVFGASSKSERPAVVFDGDDTLWSTEGLYDVARDQARKLVELAELDGAAWEALERRIDVDNVKTLGYSPKRFPTSCVQAYEALCLQEIRQIDAELVVAIRAAAGGVFESDPPNMPDAEATLAELKSRGVRLALLTKGDPLVQARRVERSGLAHFFDMIRIVEEKTPAMIKGLVDDLGTEVGQTWMVGNSLRSDILPAIQAGLRALWIDAHVWEHERSHDHLADETITAVTRLADVTSWIVGPSQQHLRRGASLAR